MGAQRPRSTHMESPLKRSDVSSVLPDEVVVVPEQPKDLICLSGEGESAASPVLKLGLCPDSGRVPGGLL